MAKSILVIYHSLGGNTEAAARLVAANLPGAVYQGTVRVRALNGSSDELVEVFIEL